MKTVSMCQVILKSSHIFGLGKRNGSYFHFSSQTVAINLGVGMMSLSTHNAMMINIFARLFKNLTGSLKDMEWKHCGTVLRK